MITKEGYKRLFHFLVWISIAFIVFLVGISNIFAEEQKTGLGFLNNSNVIISNKKGVDIQLSRDTANTVNFDIKQIIFSSTYNLQANTVYEYEIETYNQYLKNIDEVKILSSNGICTFLGVSGLNSSYVRVRFTCSSATSTFTVSLSNSNDNNITNSYNIRWSSIYLWSIIDTVDLGPIINNQTQNTQDIINNNDENTENIINNQNTNTDKEIESQKVCNSLTIDKSNVSLTGSFLGSNGSIITNQNSSNWGITDYISVNYVRKLNTYGSTPSLCFYDINKTLISCSANSSLSNDDIILPNGTKFIRASINLDENKPQYYVETCQNGNQALNDSIDKVDDTLKDDNVDENGVADAFESFNDYLDDNSTITQLITLPITLYTAILNNLNGSCSPFNLGNLYGEDLILPCINISQYLGNSLWTMIDIIISGFAVYAISKKMIKVFNNFSSLREGDVIDD